MLTRTLTNCSRLPARRALAAAHSVSRSRRNLCPGMTYCLRSATNRSRSRRAVSRHFLMMLLRASRSMLAMTRTLRRERRLTRVSVSKRWQVMRMGFRLPREIKSQDQLRRLKRPQRLRPLSNRLPLVPWPITALRPIHKLKLPRLRPLLLNNQLLLLRLPPLNLPRPPTTAQLSPPPKHLLPQAKPSAPQTNLSQRPARNSLNCKPKWKPTWLPSKRGEKSRTRRS